LYRNFSSGQSSPGCPPAQKQTKSQTLLVIFLCLMAKRNFSLCCTWRRAGRKLMAAIISRLRTHTAARQIHRHRLSKPFFYLVNKTLYSLLYLVHLAFFSNLAGMSPYISLKIKKRHYEHHMIEAHKYLITWISDDISFENSG